MTDLAEYFTETADADPLWLDLTQMIQERHEATPRHRQVELGPSDVSHPCMRRLAYGMLQVPRCNPEFDPLPSILGVAAHKWMESAARLANEKLGRKRWHVETRVNVAPGLSGSSDLYDADTGTVIDWKFLGYTSFDKCRRDPGPQYKMQVFLYGRGYLNAGLPVKRVAIAFLPRSGTLYKMHLWQADYDDSIAEYALRKRETVIAMLNDFQIEQHSERFEWIPKEPFECMFCPWFRATPQSPLQCSGDE